MIIRAAATFWCAVDAVLRNEKVVGGARADGRTVCCRRHLGGAGDLGRGDSRPDGHFQGNQGHLVVGHDAEGQHIDARHTPDRRADGDHRTGGWRPDTHRTEGRGAEGLGMANRTDSCYRPHTRGCRRVVVADSSAGSAPSQTRRVPCRLTEGYSNWSKGLGRSRSRYWRPFPGPESRPDRGSRSSDWRQCTTYPKIANSHVVGRQVVLSRCVTRRRTCCSSWGAASRLRGLGRSCSFGVGECLTLKRWKGGRIIIGWTRQNRVQARAVSHSKFSDGEGTGFCLPRGGKGTDARSSTMRRARGEE
ncbi:hypothetical protein GE09DRAFT_418954 [Coniochaeta sp. 2T2.1]|nr:hypothetical protein GE09DRAFT_418954 [Coniochaeta sp. 2T2.1]